MKKPLWVISRPQLHQLQSLHTLSFIKNSISDQVKNQNDQVSLNFNKEKHIKIRQFIHTTVLKSRKISECSHFISENPGFSGKSPGKKLRAKSAERRVKSSGRRAQSSGQKACSVEHRT
jgi:hypothetical protein